MRSFAVLYWDSMPLPTVSTAELRRRAERARYHAKVLADDPAVPRLLALAEELEAKAAELEAEQTARDGPREGSGVGFGRFAR